MAGNVVNTGAEIAPWSKTGGLGDVLGGLPPAIGAVGKGLGGVLSNSL
ncbi:glycogen/starch synthase [Enterobacteriaceae bacterium BIT-l23]|nr:glycogen/starch synthase [Enterobacteriaceae bacterium BIT-l23]